MNYQDWPIKSLSVTNLHLDPSNPRLATSVKRLPQPDLIAELLLHEHVIDLARDISRLGFFPNEPLVAIKDGANTVVVEGNRRLAALKILLNPELAPPEYRSRLSPLISKGKPVPEKIGVIIAPSRNDAVPLIIARHKGKPVEAWTPIQQARFILDRVEAGLSIDDVADETGLERSEIVKSVRDAKLYDVVRSLELPSNVQPKVSDPHAFPFTTLRRLMDMSSVQKAFKVKADEKAGFRTTLGADRFKRALLKIVTDIAEGNVTSRNVNTAEEVDEYLKTIFPKTKGDSDHKGDTEVSADDMVDPAKIKPVPSRRGRKATNKSGVSKTLVPKSYRVEIEDDRILAIVDELKRLSLSSFPNAIAITFRSLIEMAVTRYLQEAGELQKIIAKQSKGSPKKPDWTPTLRQQLVHIQQEASIPITPEGRKALGKFLSDTKDSLTLDVMNWFTHNRYIPPTADQLRAFYVNLRPLLDLTLHLPEEAAE